MYLTYIQPKGHMLCVRVWHKPKYTRMHKRTRTPVSHSESTSIHTHTTIFQAIRATDHTSCVWLYPSLPLVSSFVIIQRSIHNMHFALQGRSPHFLSKEPFTSGRLLHGAPRLSHSHLSRTVCCHLTLTLTSFLLHIP